MTEKQQQDVKVCQDNLHENTESFLYYASNLRVIEQLPLEVRAFVNMAILEYGVGREISRPVVVIDGAKVDIRILFRQVFVSIDVEKRRYKNKEMINRYQEKVTKAYEEKKYPGLSAEKVEEAKKKMRQLIYEVNKHDIGNIEGRLKDCVPIEIFKKDNPLPKALICYTEYCQEALTHGWISDKEFEVLISIHEKINLQKQQDDARRIAKMRKR